MSEEFPTEYPSDYSAGVEAAQDVDPRPSETVDSGLPSGADAYPNDTVATPRNLEELTLLQAFGLLIYRPARASRALWRVVFDVQNPPRLYDNGQGYAHDSLEADAWLNDERPATYQAEYLESDTYSDTEPWPRKLVAFLQPSRDEIGMLGILLLALLFAFLAASRLHEAAPDPIEREPGDIGFSWFWVMLSAGMGIAYSVLYWRRLQRHEAAHVVEHETVAQPSLFDDATDDTLIPHASHQSLADSTEINAMRRLFASIERYVPSLSLVPIALLMSYLAYSSNVATNVEGEVTGIIFTTFGFTMWLGAMFTWFIIFTIDFNALYRRLVARDWPQITVPQFQLQWMHVLLLLIVLVGGYFRLHRLDEVPPEMTSDHIEKLIDAVKVDDGVYAVFFENNGGREAFQMYTVAVIADWFNVGFNFTALKYATIIEGMLTIILSYWVAKEVIGRDTPERDSLGTWVALGTAGLMALSFWHIMLSRLGLRIALTPLTVFIVTYFLVRAMRYNRRIDFALMGLTLGIGTYFYQANRMLPVLVVVCIAIAALVKSRTQFSVIWRYGFNLSVAGLIAIVAYLPMYRYSEEFPVFFWERSYGRIFGEGYYGCIGDDGLYVGFCRPPLTQMLTDLQLERYGPQQDETAWEAFTYNYRDAFFTYVYGGDRLWITNSMGDPALDQRSAGLYIVGALLWLMMMFRLRDVGLAIAPIGILILILPSALAVAPTLSENPSFTRISGTVPFVFMMASLPLAMLIQQASRIGRHAGAYRLASVAVIILLLINISERNYERYFEDYRTGYEVSWRPYSDIGEPLRAFAEGEGSFGNAFYVNYPHWLDHRVLGSSAGDLAWPNGLFEADGVFAQLLANQGTDYEYDPDRPMLFYVHEQDVEDIEWLENTFPDGEWRRILISGDTNFLTYETQPGLDWIGVALSAQTIGQGCNLNCLPGPQ